MNAPFPLNPGVGDWFGNWVWNGARWVASPTTGLRQNVATFTQSGPYMPSPGLVSLTVECIGGGGAGGAAGPTPDPTYVVTGGGGGSGGYSRRILPAALVRGGVMVTIGAGGVAELSGAESSGDPTSFGALCIANGGGYGLDNDGTNLWGLGGTGAQPGIGDVAFPGSCGGAGLVLVAAGVGGFAGGIGGVIFGGNQNDNTAGPGHANGGLPGAPNTGAGGTGAVQNQVGAGTPLFSGGNGGSGLCIVTETIVGDRDQPETSWRPPLDVNVSFPRSPWPGGQPGPVPPWPWPPGAPWWPWPPQPLPPRPPGPQPRELEYEADQPAYQPWGEENGD